MKSLFTTFVCGLLLCQAAQAQNTFKIEPNPANIMAPPDLFDAAVKSKVINMTPGTKQMRWERTIISLPPDIISLVCDKNLCWTSTVSTKDFELVPNDSATLDAHFLNPMELSGQTAVVHLKVTNLANANDTETGIYLYNLPTSTGQPLPAADVKLFPNPVVDYFTLDNAASVASVRVFGMDGRVAALYNAAPDQRYETASWTPGVYIVVLEDAQGRIFQAVEITKH